MKVTDELIDKAIKAYSEKRHPSRWDGNPWGQAGRANHRAAIKNLLTEVMKEVKPVKKTVEEKLLFVGYTNGLQILYGSTDEGIFYNNTNGNCHIPLYMLSTHAHRIETTAVVGVTLNQILANQKQSKKLNEQD